jgi:hypothetical protein
MPPPFPKQPIIKPPHLAPQPAPMIDDTDIEQKVINRLCHVLARDLYHHHQPAACGPTQQSDALQTALVVYIALYDPKPKESV